MNAKTLLMAMLALAVAVLILSRFKPKQETKPKEEEIKPVTPLYLNPIPPPQLMPPPLIKPPPSQILPYYVFQPRD